MRLGDLEITGNGFRASFGNEFWSPDEGNYFLYLDVTFTNTGDQPVVLSSLLQMTVQDNQGFQYSVDFAAIAASDVGVPEGEIAPGGSLRGELGYQIPTKSSDLVWKFSGDIFRLGQAAFSIGTVAVPTATPVPVGHTLDNPVLAGRILTGSDGTDIVVIGIIPNAWQQVAEENMFNEPPEEGKRFYMVMVEVSNPPGADSVTVSDFDFKLIGSSHVVYTTLENRCGLIPGKLRGEIYGGGQLQGNVCFEIPMAEEELVLIHEPGFGAESRRYLSLTGGM